MFENNLNGRYTPLDVDPFSGGFGAAQLVHDNYLDRVVVYKSMRNSSDNQQLYNEIKLLSHARSRHVVEIYDVVRDQGDEIVGIIIEFLEGRGFEDFYLEASADSDNYLRIVYQVAVAINDLHRAGVVHRDIKLDNVKTSSSGLVKLFDFGISTDQEDYRTRMNRGTLVYAAPELFLDNALIVPEIDVYALGVCAWALASRSFPPELLQVPPQSSARAPSIEHVMPGLSREVIECLDSCLAINYRHRPSAEKVRDTLGKQLVRWKHRGIFTQENQHFYELNHAKRNVSIKVDGVGLLKVVYTGSEFLIGDVAGSVFINNSAAVIGEALHDSCVITFGSNSMGSNRTWVAFSSSHPEVVL